MGRKQSKKLTIKKGGVSRVRSASIGRKSNSRKSKSIKSTGSMPKLNIGSRDPIPRRGETKKKYVAAQQNWKCAHCKNQLPPTFEVDHKIDLQYGGTNHVSNLAALCRNCHGNKTMMNNL